MARLSFLSHRASSIYLKRMEPDSKARKPMRKQKHHLAYLNLVDMSGELYKSIVEAAYEHAVEVTKNLTSNGNGDIVSNVVKKLAQQNNRNLLNFVYQLWNSPERSTVIDLLPQTFESIFSQENVILLHKKYGLALKLDVNKDNDGDRIAWGDSYDKTSIRVVWKLTAFWENNKVFFRLKNVDCNMDLKLELIPNPMGDRGAFGSSDKGEDDIRHTWYLEPVLVDKEFLFYMVNRQLSQGLKLAESVDSYNDRRLYGHNGEIYSDPERFAWYINRHA